MSHKISKRAWLVRGAVAFMLMALAVAAIGCKGQDQSAATTTTEPTPAEKPAPEPEQQAPEYSKWVVYVNDDDSFEKGGITYSIALNLTATNPTSNPAGTYTGKAVAKTDSTGEYKGQQLNASAIANSSKLEFTLEDPTGTIEDPLAPLVAEDQTLSGSGSIVMKASGGGTYGQAGGSFSNTSGQNLAVDVKGSEVTLKVTIEGHKYTFTGTLSGK